ncbi:MAG: glycogen/starch synthase [Candidatus Aenigmarchaeota archaeon]|nr:glycogen/starch synthase [Candidatus Aenigmarchaeota archaeon]
MGYSFPITKKIVFVTPELKTFKNRAGGLGQVAEELVKSLKELGLNVITISTLYKYRINDYNQIEEIDYSDLNLELIGEIEIPIEKIYKTKIYKVNKYDIDFYFLYNEEICTSLYYGDLLKYAIFLGKGTLELLRYLKIIPDIIHLNDALTSLVAFYAKNSIHYYEFSTVKFVFTIHNAGTAYQQIYDISRLNEISDNNHKDLVYDNKINLLYCGVKLSDIVNTVSKDYEVTLKVYGEGLKEIFNQKNVFGIVNGIDVEFWQDKDYRNSNYKNILDIKRKKKEELIRKIKEITGKELDINKIIISIPRRISHQKGFEETIPIIPEMINLGAQFIVLGKHHPNDGYGKYIADKFRELHQKYNEFVFIFGFNEELAKLMYAGSDLLLYPSLPNKEPCGTGYMMALVNATPTLGTKTGGLDEVLKEFDDVSLEGNAFLVWEDEYNEFKGYAFLSKFKHIVEIYKDKTKWKKLLINCLKSEKLVDMRKCAIKYIRKIYFKLI